MKKLLTILAASIVLVAFTGESNKSAATVDQKEGLYIFMLSKPIAETEYLGTVTKKIAWTGKPEEMLNSMLKKAKKEYPRANGIIFTSIDMDKADIVFIK